jgi:hypothetical protein
MTNLHEIRLQLRELAPFTKKDLQAIYDLSGNTVYNTLQACGLPTSATQYELEEIDTKFHAARELVAKGMNYKQVTDHFGIGKQAQPLEEPSASGFGESEAQDGVTATDLAAFKLVNAVAQESARKAGKAFIPLFQLHLGKELASSGFQESVDSAVELLAPKRSGDVNAFLLQGLDSTGLLPLSMQQNALPPASNQLLEPQYSAID